MHYIFKKNLFSIVFSMLLCTLQSNGLPLVQKVKNIFKHLSKNLTIDTDTKDRIATTAVESYWGARHVSEGTQVYIRTMLQKAGLANWQTIRIRQLSKLAMGVQSEKNALAIEYQGIQYLYINEAWFNTLSQEKKDFLILHEAMHLKHDHLKKKDAFNKKLFYLLFTCALAGLVNIVIDSKATLLDSDIELSFKVSSLAKCTYAALVGCATFVLGKLSIAIKCRSYELEADASAAKLLGSFEGAEQLFQELQERDDIYDLDYPQEPALIQARKMRREYNASHPSYQTRLEHIKKTLKQ